MPRMLRFSWVLGIALLTTPFAQAAPILSTSGGVEVVAGDPSSFGWEFQTGSSPVTVVALDAQFTNFFSTQVRLYNSLGITLRSTTVTAADPAETAGLTWHSHPISPITLAPDTTYFIAQDVPVNGAAFFQTSTPTLSDGVQYLGGVSGAGAGTNPTSDLFSEGNPAYFGPNFDPAAPIVATIPEPSTLSLLAAGLGLASWWRRRRAGVSA